MKNTKNTPKCKMNNLQKLPFYKAQKLADMLETQISIIFPRMQNMARVAQTCAGIEPNYVLHNLRSQGRIQIFKTNIPEGFKSCFDTGFQWYKSRAAISAKNYGFTKQKHIRGDKTLKVQNFGPNVAYYFYFVLSRQNST